MLVRRLPRLQNAHRFMCMYLIGALLIDGRMREGELTTGGSYGRDVMHMPSTLAMEQSRVLWSSEAEARCWLVGRWNKKHLPFPR
jgi:hypothetical protein